ncbi:MAG: transcriptional repressor [Anaerolineae bacterium]|nr:transcriptional repressor [Anaerolineae bacterium]
MVVLDVMHDLPGYNTAEDIYDAARHANPDVDRSTVYRTLELLQSLNMVLALEREGDLRRFTLHVGHANHFHLLCIRCGRVMDADKEMLTSLQRDLMSHHDFQIDLGHLTINGLCRECADNTKDS